jgi:c-di-AMP phosphodiesterase-like protein
LDNVFKNRVQSYFKGQLAISKEMLVESILLDFPELKEGTINVYLSRLKKEGVIKNPTRGFYSLEEKKLYIPTVDNKSKQLYNKIKRDYPYAEFCIWNTKWLNEFMRHQPFKFYTVVELDKDVTESVFHTLKELGRQVFMEPDAETFDLYISNSEDVIILKHLISEAPLQETDKIAVPTLEKLLVDMTIDTKVYAAQQSEIESIYVNAFDKYEVNKNKMKRYAYRRNRNNEVTNLTNLTLAKIE